MMRLFAGWFGLALFGSPAVIAGNQEPVLQPVSLNVNSRYTIESVDVASEALVKISKGLREDLNRLIGEKFNAEALDDLARRIRGELRVRDVHPRLARGATPDRVKVIFDVASRRVDFDVAVPRAVYSSSRNWSGEVDGSAIVRKNSFTLGLVSDGDEEVGRFTGIRAAWEDRKLGSDRVRLRFLFETYHDQWDRSTLEAADNSGIYRSHRNFEPVATVALTRSVSLSFGAGFQSLEEQVPAARTEASNAVITTLRYQRQVEDSGPIKQDLDAGYSLRAATRMLGSDFVYARHRWQFRYALSSGRHQVIDEVTAGLITGQAPLYERFVLGTSSLLRGWNKSEIDPLGGSRVAHNSLEYRYGMLEVFYDAGAVWSVGQAPAPRHSIGVGVRKSVFTLALAFPIRNGSMEPTILVGMNY